MVDPIDEQAEFIHKFDGNSRGEYLIQVIYIEDIIDDIFGYHFCVDKKEEREMLIATLINNLGFNSKINNLLKILELKYPNLKNKYSELEKQLEHIRELRNKFAHSTPDSTIEFLKKKTDYIQLRFYKNGKRQNYKITKEFIDEKIVECGQTIISLLKILEFISKGQADIDLRDLDPEKKSL